MTIIDKIAFPPHEGLPWMNDPPAVDGFVEPEPGLATAQLDAGYVHGSRFVYDGGAGIPLAVFQGIKHNAKPYIYLSFIARFDPSFDEDDFVMIVLRPTAGAAASTQDRRIDIQPSVGAGGADAVPVDANDHTGSFPEVKTHKAAHILTFYERNGGGTTWTELPSTAPPDIQNFDTSVRTVNTGSARFWSVEIKIPTQAGTGPDQGGNSWITLNKDFGLFFDIGRVYMEGGVEKVVQFPWPFDPDAPLDNVLSDPFGGGFKANWDPTTLGTATLLNVGDPNPMKGVRFKGYWNGIGIDAGGPSLSSELNMELGHIDNLTAQLQNTGPSAPGVTARFRIAEFGIGGPYGNSAAWVNVPASPNPAGGSAIPPTADPINGHTDITLPWTISNPDRSTFGPLSRDQCLWVQLDSNAGAGAVSFVENSVRRNLTLTHLSQAEHKAVLDGRHFGKSLTKPGTHEFELHVQTVEIRPNPYLKRLEAQYKEFLGDERRHPGVITDNPLLTGAIAEEPAGAASTATHLSVVHAYQLTSDTLTFNGKKRRITNYVGSYGYITKHVVQAGESLGAVEVTHVLAQSPGLKRQETGIYRVEVGENQRLELVNRIGTGKVDDGPPSDGTGGDGGGGKPKIPGCGTATGALLAVFGTLGAVLQHWRR